MTIEECLRAIVREEVRPVEIKLSLVASLILQLCRELECPTPSTSRDQTDFQKDAGNVVSISDPVKGS